MKENDTMETGSLRDAMIFVFTLITIGSVLGSTLHFYPFPVNGSVFVEGKTK